MATIAELSSALDAAVKNMNVAKELLNKAHESYTKASAEHDNSVIKANEVRQELDKLLNELLPSQSGRVR